MQLYVNIDLDEPLTLPINHNKILQAIIYAGLGGARYKSYMHDQGFAYEKRKFKLFTFSLLTGKNHVENQKITFYDDVSFEVRSPDPFFIRILKDGFELNGIRFGERCFRDINLTFDDLTVESDMILVEMVSPLTVYSSDPKSRQTYYYSPEEPEFETMVVANFYRKYSACYGAGVENDVRIVPYSIGRNDRIVTWYNATPITAYKGQYVIAGERKYLDFMYQTGLGSKNAQGFGMFDIIADADDDIW